MDHRERLVEAAIGELQERGYARTTTRGIVAAAGSHLPAVNYYFGSKERLLQDAAVEALSRWCEATMKAADDPDVTDPRERLRRSLERFLATLEADRPYVVAALEAFAQAERSEDLRERMAGAYRDFRELVARSVERDAAAPGAVPTPEALGLASVLIALFDGLAIQWLLDPGQSLGAERLLESLSALAAVLAS